MYNRSKLQNAKLKISKLKEKYFNTHTSDTDNDLDVKESFPSSDLLIESSKPQEDQFNKVQSLGLTKTNSPEMKVYVNDGDNDENIRFTTSNKLGLKEVKHISSNSSSLQSELSKNYSKISSHTLKAESIVLSELSNQFEHICFLSSSSEEENPVHPTNFTTLNSVKSPSEHGSAKSPIVESCSTNNIGKPINEFLLTNKVNNKLRAEDEVSAVNSYLSPISSEEELHKSNYSSQTGQFIKNLDTEDLLPKSKRVTIDSNSTKHERETNIAGKQTVMSDSKYNDTSFTNSNKNIETSICRGFEDRAQALLFRNIRHSNKIGEKVTEMSVPDCTDKSKKKKNKTKTLNGGKINYSINAVKKAVSSGEYTEEIKYSQKISRQKKFTKTPYTFKHATAFKPSSKRPFLKSCILVSSDSSWEENKMLTQVTLLEHDKYEVEKLRGSGYDKLANQLLWSQIQLIRQFTQSHHHMYLLCCQAVKLLSEEHNKKHR